MTINNDEIFHDEIIEEFRKHREEHAASFDYDIKRIIEDFQRLERESGREVVTRPPRRPRLSKT